MKVLKFGGSSISSAKNIENVFNIIQKYESNIVVVFSAFGETTDKLIKCGKLASIRDNDYKNVLKSMEFSTKTYDTISGFGELLSYYIIGKLGLQRGLDLELKDSREIITTQLIKLGSIQIDYNLTERKWKDFSEKTNNKIIIMPGFIARDNFGNNVTLGRGGSDFTASILASVANANALEIWTDVNGIYTANPKIAFWS